MTKLTDEEFEKLFGTYKAKIVVETEQKQEDLVETTQGSNNDLATLTINLVPQNELFNISNISMLEYSELFIEDKNPAINAYAKTILTNYNNRSIEQALALDDIVSNKYSEVESAVLWLEIINSNLNQLMGLVSVNNYLLGMVGVDGGGVIQSAESSADTYATLFSVVSGGYSIAGPEGAAAAFVGYETLKTDSDYLGGILACVGLGFYAGGPVGALILGGLATFASLIDMGLKSDVKLVYGEVEDYSSYGTYDYRDPSPPGRGNINPYEYSYTLSTFIGNENYKATTEKTEDYDCKIMKKKQMNTPLEASGIVYSQPLLLILGVEDEESKIMRKKQTNTPLEASGIVYSQPGVGRSGSKNEEKPSILPIVLSGLNYINPFSTLEVGATELTPEIAKQYAKNQSNNTYANTTSKNASISEDLKESTNYGPQQIEHTYEMPITSTITINSTEKVDYEDLLRRLKREIQNEILGIKAVLL